MPEGLVGFPSGISMPGMAWFRKILYVDEERPARAAFRRCFSRRPFTVFTAAGGEQALEWVGRERFDAAVLDNISLPGIDGFELLKALRWRQPELPIIMLIGLTTDKALFRSVELECDGFLEKPYDVEDLEVQLQALIPRRPSGIHPGK